MQEKNTENREQSRIVIASTASQSGKTTLTLGLLRALANRKMSVQAFKCGPDFVDSKYYELVTGRDSYNFDTFMQSEPYILKLYEKYSRDADVCIIEGYRALFDGYDHIKGSTAQIAELTSTPVILVVDTTKEGYSVAAQIYGFINFRKVVRIIGVAFNFVKSETHLKSLIDACENIGVKVLGYLYKKDALNISLLEYLSESIDNKEPFDNYVDRLAEAVEENIDIDSILKLTTTQMVYPPINIDTSKVEQEQTFTIAVAYDKAFCFYYNENIQRFREKSKVIYFSPLNDKSLPQADFVYIPSGFPEVYLKELSANTSMIKSIRDYVEGGGYLLAECGGMLYLSKAIIGKDGIKYPMVGIFDQEGSYEKDEVVAGYRIVHFKNKVFKGYEYHKSYLLNIDEKRLAGTTLTDENGNTVPTNFFRYKNTIGGYTHIYWAEHGLIELFVLLLEQEPIYDY